MSLQATPFQFTKPDFERRIERLFTVLRQSGHRFDTAILVGRINQYYFTGTMQDGLLILRQDGLCRLYVRKSIERARLESPLDEVAPMSSYRDILKDLPADLGSTFIDMEVVPVALMRRLEKYFQFEALHPLDGIIAHIRAVKDPQELLLIRESGRQHQDLMENHIPSLLREGMSEAELLADIYARMVRLGHHGVSRFAMFQQELVVGQVGFGESSIYPTNFDGPGGMRGMSAAVPLIGDRNRLLRPGDLVFVDIGYGVQGYHSDKTQVYSFGAPPPAEALAAHRACIQVMERTSSLLVPGASPSDIYQDVISHLPPHLGPHFMGYGEDQVRFLGHGIGLQIDEIPVIAHGFNSPLQANMVIALEPKAGITGVGMVGVEETFAITAEGAQCLTGGPRDIFIV
jgi:Xaa-Pro aminopeptidase